MNDSSSQTEPTLYTIAIDAMGGDYGPEIVIPGVAYFLGHRRKRLKNIKLKFLFFGDQERIKQQFTFHPILAAKSEIIHTDRVIRMDEKPSSALRNGKGTSMRMAIEAVKKGEADAVVSAGNTGALMATAKAVLRTVPGITRPAIASVMPTRDGETIMLDLGANVLVDAEILVQFAIMGAVFARAHKNTRNPSVGLLNVGSEEMKGPDHVRAAAQVLSKIQFHGEYKGFVEGNDINKGTVDVVVCDGYAGNIALKTMEGVGKMLGEFFKQSIKSDPLAILGGFLSYFALKRFKNKADPRMYNGGVFLGLNGICVKSHGGGDDVAFSSALGLAVEMCMHGSVGKIGRDIAEVMNQDSFIT